LEALVNRYTKNPVGAHYGLADWLLQRLTAVVMALYTVGFAACLLWHKPATYADWKTLFSGSFVKLTTMFFIAALLYHAWVGMRDIVMDYVKPAGTRLALQAVIGGALLFQLIWAASILWGAR
jgi:succinate dehydrogenase / fumarate reductase membrane anchor subunit